MRELLVVHGVWLGVGLVAVAAVVGAVVQLAARRIRHRWRWTGRVDGFAKDPPVRDGERGWFEGVLRLEGPSCTSFEGSPCAVATAAAGPGRARDLHAVSRRASRLVLEVGPERLIVAGPVEVAVGAVASKGSLRDDVLARIGEASGGELEATYRALATELRRLDDGDRVWMAGTLRREAGGGTGYREAAGSLALVGDGGPVLAARGPRLEAPWVGAGLAALGAWLAISLAGAYRVHGAELVSLLHRHDALRQLGPRERLHGLDPNDHAARAAALRELDRPAAALREASRGSDPAALHERLVLLREPGRGRFAATWLRLVAALDARCAKGGRCLDHARVAEQTLTPTRWAGPTPTRAPLEVLFSEVSATDHGTTLALAARLWDLRPKSSLVARLRVTWLFELAATLMTTGAHDGARQALARIERALDDPRLRGPARRRVRRDLDHMNAVLAIREGRARALTATERHHEGGWCPMRDAVRLAANPRGRGPTAFPSFGHGFAATLSAVRRSGVMTEEMRADIALGAASPVERAVQLAPLVGRESRGELRAWLEADARCPASMTVAALARETSRSRALYVLGALEASEAALACVGRRSDAIEGPWATGGDPRPRGTAEHERVAAVGRLQRFLSPRARPPRRRRARPRHGAIVHPRLPVRARVAAR